MILTPAQVTTLQKVQAAANQVLPKLEFLEGLAAVNPSLRERTKELRDRREYLNQLATTALEMNRNFKERS